VISAVSILRGEERQMEAPIGHVLDEPTRFGRAAFLRPTARPPGIGRDSSPPPSLKRLRADVLHSMCTIQTLRGSYP
jgi:hypothetical protein